MPPIPSGSTVVEQAKERAVSLLERSQRPQMLGFLAAEMGWGLEQSEEILGELVSTGKLRRLSQLEATKRGFSPRSVVYSLPEKPTSSPLVVHTYEDGQTSTGRDEAPLETDRKGLAADV